jgi:hypothetical protein
VRTILSRSRGSMNLRLLSTLGVILGAIGWAGGGDRPAGRDKEIASLTARSAEANAALVPATLILTWHSSSTPMTTRLWLRSEDHQPMGLTRRLRIGQRWRDSSSPARFTKRSWRHTTQPISSFSSPSRGFVLWSANCLNRTGLFASRKSFVMRAPNGNSYTGTPIR